LTESKIPFDPEAEKSVLAGILMDPQLMDVYGDSISSKMFHDAKHSAIFDAMKKAEEKGLGIDIITVASELSAQDKLNMVGGESWLLELQSTIVGTANFESWCKVIKDLWCRREVMSLCDKAKSKAMDCSVSVLETCNSMESSLHDNATSTVPNANRTSTDVMKKTITDMQDSHEELKRGGKSQKRVMFGIPWIDEFVKIYRGGLGAIGAFTGVGKTAWELQCFTSQALNAQAVCLGCTESSAEELLLRVYAHMSHVSIEDALEPKDDKVILALQQAHRKMARFKDNWMIWGEDDWESDIDKFCYLVSNFKRRMGKLDMFWLDHFCDIPMLASKGDSDKFAPVQRAMTKLKRLAIKTDSAGMILSQFTKASQEERRPSLASFYGSSFFTQPLRSVSIIYNTDMKPGQPRKERENCSWYTVKGRLGSGFCKQITYVGKECTFYPQTGIQSAYSSSNHRYDPGDDPDSD